MPIVGAQPASQTTACLRTNHSGTATGQAPLLRDDFSKGGEGKYPSHNGHGTALLPRLQFHLPRWLAGHECAAAALGTKRYTQYGSPGTEVATTLHAPPGHQGPRTILAAAELRAPSTIPPSHEAGAAPHPTAAAPPLHRRPDEGATSLPRCPWPSLSRPFYNRYSPGPCKPPLCQGAQQKSEPAGETAALLCPNPPQGIFVNLKAKETPQEGHAGSL